ncbi:MAG: Fe-S protein assembly co-chaperone HscB [Gammaproteobacteria bacterium]|nr:Fe-S protein assembly co-chaperone HscB [Gammaproteobacteria bacterium]
MDIDLTRNYFELFGLPEGFEMDQEELTSKYRAFQGALHPDRFSGKSSQEQRISMQQTVFVNEAYSVLRSDLKRAHYLLKLQDLEFDADTETSRDTAFLMQQMELHERVAELDEAVEPIAALDTLASEFKHQQQDLISRFSSEYAQGHLDAAKELALKLQFYERLTNQLREKQEKLEEQLL